MDHRVFTFAGLINDDHNFIIGFYAVFCALFTLIISRIAAQRLQMVPFGLQNIYEAVIEGILSVAKDVIGEELARKYFPLTGTIALFVFYANMIGIVPGFEAPTANWSFTLVLALIVFFYYHFEGIRSQGFIRYFAHFLGPVKWLMPIMFPVEIVSHLSRIISLSFRLFGNIKGDDMFLLIMLLLVPWVIPVAPFMVLFFMGILQAFVFMILTYVYLAGAVLVDEGH
ncbi:F0F1 ATP synthase subunit A [Helicobacter suis]|uniref:ATP synthase subunit a n=2 Tax=Helicobacter suis TaxID=104628 RepID=E7G3Q8_9HELI|nr:F0F1 ATP synthase subunit A [Helicobacter suis]EFX41980.1 F0F1 ATP synthase subunit A [Helicobacter suis HS5]EFX43643.1 F0F1 ATP synthase subunit A [Helicobacter suis HS1]BCD46005.1 F0F1 ATP synthase subunit A AtpB [Helicobacter suis]BCD48069.1 F0F1 ATP synthase subunit A AtpB [Helicobacter suis]BCD49831.1 F0F1 ATP synthase subunit A AtpB [Helicobacter suis]